MLSRSVVSNSLRPHGVAHQAPLSMGCSRQEYWSGLSCPPLEDLPNPGIKHRSPTLQADSLRAEPPGKLKNTGVGAYIFFRRSSQPRNWTGVSCIAGGFFYQLSHKGSPQILEWVSYPFSSNFSQSRNWTGVSCIVGRFIISWATRETEETRVGSLSLLQGNFLMPESNPGPPYCKQILYQLNYQGSPI